MIQLENETEKILQFIQNGITAFETTHGKAGSMGLYCCPWSGWLSLCFNKTRTIAETQQNCPDFEFVEFAMLDRSAWADEYESDNMSFRFENAELVRDETFGDEQLNRFVFNYLETLLPEIQKTFAAPVLLQMLDSGCCKVF